MSDGNKSVLAAFISLLKSAVTETDEAIDFNDVDFASLYSLAKFHDLAHIVCYELDRRGVTPDAETAAKFKKKFDVALFCRLKRELIIETARDAFEKAKIPFILLKGAYLMELYPDSWMRTSSDVDVLVKEEDFKAACESLESVGWKPLYNGYNCAVFETNESYHVELHFSLTESVYSDEANAIMKKVWDYAYPKQNGAEYLLRDDMFCFYLFAHASKHFRNGGCGVRFFMDIWLLDHKTSFDKAAREALLQEGKLTAFADKARELSEVWFSGAAGSDDLDEFEDYIINGGLYGTMERSIAAKKKKNDGRFKYYIKRVFLPYSSMKRGYPVLEKAPFLLPFCWVVRWFKLLDPKVRLRTKDEIRIEKSVGKETGDKLESMMKKLEIW